MPIKEIQLDFVKWNLKKFKLQSDLYFMRKLFYFLIMAFVLAGCGSQPKHTKEQWNELTNRKYKIGEDEVYKTIEKIFNLMDASDILITHGKNGMLARRKYTDWITFSVSTITGYYFFNFNIKEDKKLHETSISLEITFSLSEVFSQKRDGDFVVNGTPIYWNATYNLFWSRFEFLIKKSNKWISCKEAGYFDFRKILGDGLVEPLCHRSDDLFPSKP